MHYPSFEQEAEPLLAEYNCLHFKFPILLGISRPAYSDAQLEHFKTEDKQTFEFEGRKYTKYEGTQLQRRMETAVRNQKDLANIAKAAGDDDLRREAQYKINLLTSKYAKLADASGLPTKMERMDVRGFRSVRAESVDNLAARAAVRNTHKALTFDEKADFSVRFDILPEKVNKSISEACLKVAKLGGEQRIEYLSLINLETGKEDFFESGNEFSVGSRKFWNYIKNHKDDKFAFIHNHNTDGYFSETDMSTFLYNEPIQMLGAIRIDGVKYFAEKTSTLDKSVHFDELFENELKDLNYKARHGIISGGERTRLREEIIVDNLLERYTKGLIELDGG